MKLNAYPLCPDRKIWREQSYGAGHPCRLSLQRELDRRPATSSMSTLSNIQDNSSLQMSRKRWNEKPLPITAEGMHAFQCFLRWCFPGAGDGLLVAHWRRLLDKRSKLGGNNKEPSRDMYLTAFLPVYLAQCSFTVFVFSVYFRLALSPITLYL